MNQQPDKFFRDKLYDYQKAVSPDAWNRVSRNLEKQSQWSVAMKVAAAVLLLATATLLIYPTLNKEGDSLISADHTPPVTSTPPVAGSELKNPPQADSQVQPDQPDAQTSQERRAIQKPSRKGTPPSDVAAVDNNKREPANPGMTSPKAGDQQEIENPIAELPAPTPVDSNVASVTVANPQESMRLVFTAEEVNRKYLTKNVETEATTDEEETSGLKKLLDKAYDLKHNQDLLGSLRQKKNEILAMNFKSEKQTTQNE